jgi:hypothetical protein
MAAAIRTAHPHIVKPALYLMYLPVHWMDFPLHEMMHDRLGRGCDCSMTDWVYRPHRFFRRYSSVMSGWRTTMRGAA